MDSLKMLLGDRDANVVLLESQIEECDGMIETKTAKISNLREQLSTEKAFSLERSHHACQGRGNRPA